MVCEDNRACLLMSENTVSRERSRHIDPIQFMVADMSRHKAIRCMFVRELVGLGVIKLVSCSTQKMVANTLTKSLPEPALKRHRDEMLGDAKAPYCAYLLTHKRPLRALNVEGG